MKIKVLLFVFVTVMPFETSAQIFKKIQKEAERKLMKKVEDRVVEEVSNAIVRAAYKPIDKQFDKMVKAYYGSDTLENGEIDWDKVNRNYSGMMANMDASDKLPDGYLFDLYIDARIQDYDGKKTDVRMYYSTTEPIFGIRQEMDGEEGLVIMDGDNELIAIYREEDGQQTVQAVPMVVLQGMGTNNSNPYQDFKFEPNGKIKEIAGYKSKGYDGETDDETIECYMAENFPISWQDAYGGFIKQFAPQSFSDASSVIKGMVMYSENRLKEDDKKFSLWEVKKVHKKTYKVDNSEWEVVSFQNQ